ncbi:MAG: LysR family transcriptional regulator [Limosilactobacillus sp.]|uniref:LysR substrate-binding domain-containing protein n=1 Tax=Limosilactobacillus sp. TaxID=2773925 RepID=UPI00270DE57E|nr:LysR family transcriptional regulator [Limosilactobacillus sp.]
MDTRVLKYFLTVARTNNITQAATQLHITQPTLSRQIMELEDEIGTPLFDRSERRLKLTKAGVLFQSRATAILNMIDQTKDELKEENGVSGTISLGCVASSVSPLMMKMVGKFQEQYPGVKFRIYDGDGDVLRRLIDERRLDFACLIEPVETAKYNGITLPASDKWGILMKASDPLAKLESLSADELYNLPLVVPHRNIVFNLVSDIMKVDEKKMNIKATANLPSNMIELVRTGKYYALSIQSIIALFNDPDLAFVPIEPVKFTGHQMIWLRNEPQNFVSKLFLEFVKTQLKA